MYTITYYDQAKPVYISTNFATVSANFKKFRYCGRVTLGTALILNAHVMRVQALN